MKNFKKLLIAGLMLCMVPQVALPMKRATEASKNALTKTFKPVWEYAKKHSPIQVELISADEPALKKSTLHPDIEAFLRREVAKKSSLSAQDIAKLRFEELPKDKPTLDHMEAESSFAFSLTSFSLASLTTNTDRSIRVPNLDVFFKAETKEGTTLVEIPDEELPPHLKIEKDLLRAFLKHEEGHCYHKHNPLINKAMCLSSLLLATTQGLPFVSIPGIYWHLSSMISKYQERQADIYAINHTEDPSALREAGNYFMIKSSRTGKLRKTHDSLYGTHPSHKSRANRFLEAAEKLEKQAKDRD